MWSEDRATNSATVSLKSSGCCRFQRWTASGTMRSSALGFLQLSRVSSYSPSFKSRESAPPRVRITRGQEASGAPANQDEAAVTLEILL